MAAVSPPVRVHEAGGEAVLAREDVAPGVRPPRPGPGCVEARGPGAAQHGHPVGGVVMSE